MRIRSMHYFSGLLLAVFIFLHLINHLYSLIGIDKHLAYMQQFRKIYRNPWVEIPLLGAVLVQLYSGIQLVRNKPKKITGFYNRLQIWTGRYMAFFLVIHVGAVITGRLFLHLDTNFYFGAAGINSFPFNLFFIPYYTLAIWSFFGHIAAIHYQKMSGKSHYANRQSAIILSIGIVISIVILYGLTGGFKGVPIPASYEVLIGK